MPMIRIREETYAKLSRLSMVNGLAMTVIVEMAIRRMPVDLGLSASSEAVVEGVTEYVEA